MWQPWLLVGKKTCDDLLQPYSPSQLIVHTIDDMYGKPEGSSPASSMGHCRLWLPLCPKVLIVTIMQMKKKVHYMKKKMMNL